MLSDADLETHGTKMVPRTDSARTDGLLARIRAMNPQLEPVVMRVYLHGKSRPHMTRPLPQTYVVIPFDVGSVGRSILVPTEGASSNGET